MIRIEHPSVHCCSGYKAGGQVCIGDRGLTVGDNPAFAQSVRSFPVNAIQQWSNGSAAAAFLQMKRRERRIVPGSARS
jgi:hypothetical protein